VIFQISFTSDTLGAEARRSVSVDTVAQNRTVNWMFLRPYKQTWSQACDFHPKCCDVTTDRGAARGHTNSPHSKNPEFRCRYLSHIRGRDGVMASPSIRPSALMGPTGNHGMPRTATAASKLGVFDLKYNT
jgi:hypothetical protein